MAGSRARAQACALLILAALAGCSRGVPETTVQIGHHRVRLAVPAGWEHLDHGREQLFRNGEVELRLEDLGPATREGLLHELREAEALWLAGRRADAVARLRTLHGPPVRFLPSESRAEFWKPWTDVTYAPGVADSEALGRALGAVIRNAESLPETPAGMLVEHVLLRSSNAERREIARRDSLLVHGARWLRLETWDRVSHQDRRNLAILADGGYLLTLSTERGVHAQTSGAFDSLLATIEPVPAR